MHGPAGPVSPSGTYTLTLLENLCTLAYPALTGFAVDGLLAHSYRGLAGLIAVWLVHLVIAFVRQRYDTRVVALVAILIDFTRSPGFSAGAVYAVLAYVYDYLEGLDHAPTLVNNLARLKDVRARLEA